MTSVFEDEVKVQTKNKVITSDYVKYNKNSGYLLIKGNIIAIDKNNNIINAEFAEYFEEEETFKTKGVTRVTTSEKYILDGSDILINNKNKIIKSNELSSLKDLDGNKIFLDTFKYQIEKNIFKSVGNVKIIDNKKNNFEFSQIYIDTKRMKYLELILKHL